MDLLICALLLISCFLIDKYLIYPSSGRQWPATFIDWLKENSKDGRQQRKEIKENIKMFFRNGN
ncbi:hypothetical protein CLNEO_01420 [Anaerotignum neopropionicum]|uniref:Uncharacterized protein n=1 Tax=Anaerotignum neopropionicum TaxID=36847 RepID=A0A136WHK0_9FIRM|nr:hypothetical protein [Anaerotignum neopropionicum]KXL54046.1 hypothetical protein CLNEO_01420 [Anaerotignum neopropionicum]